MRRLSLRTAQFHRRLSIGDHRRLFNDRRRLFCLPVESLRLIIRAALKATDRYGSDVKNKLSSFAAVVVRLANSSPIPAQLADPTFVVNKPRVLVTPDNLPILQSEQRSAVDPKLDPSETKPPRPMFTRRMLAGGFGCQRGLLSDYGWVDRVLP